MQLFLVKLTISKILIREVLNEMSPLFYSAYQIGQIGQKQNKKQNKKPLAFHILQLSCSQTLRLRLWLIFGIWLVPCRVMVLQGTI